MVEVSNAFTLSQRSAIDVLEFLDEKRLDDDSASCASNKSNSSHASVSGRKRQFDEMSIDFISNTDDVVERFEGAHENNDEHYH
eukprot:670766-Ditylum_brightwellii.AAC.1